MDTTGLVMSAPAIARPSKTRPATDGQDRIRLAILECDIPLDRARASYGGYGDIFKLLLRTSHSACASDPPMDFDDGLEITLWNIMNEPEKYPRLEDLDAILITGSRHNSFDTDPWINTLVNYIQDALANHGSIRLIGVCFGHQIIGRALGVRVGRAPLWESGVMEVELTARGKEVFGKDSLVMHLMHQDAVFDCPQDVELLGCTTNCSVQGLYVAGRLITVQGHPEVNETIMSEVMDSRYSRGVFTKEQWENGLQEVGKPHDGLVVGQAFLRFLGA